MRRGSDLAEPKYERADLLAKRNRRALEKAECNFSMNVRFGWSLS